MNNEVAAVGLFCEDVREEKGGTVTIVGVLPDNVHVPAIPFTFPKISFYVRINVPTDFDPNPVTVALRFPNGHEDLVVNYDVATVDRGRADSRAGGNPITGLIAHGTASPFPVAMSGRLYLVVRCKGREYIAGTVNLQVGQAPASSN